MSEEPLKAVPDPETLKRLLPHDESDDLSQKEAMQLASGKPERQLEKEAKERDHDRGERFRDHFERLAIITMWLLAVVMLILGVVWTLHMILPEKCTREVQFCRWLEPDAVTVIQDILTGGLVAGLIADHFRRRIGK